jgi:hypothetical protein
MSIVLDGTSGITAPSATVSGTLQGTPVRGGLVSGTAVSASGTSIDFTGIPSWVKRITVMLSGVSTNGTGNLRFRLGSGSLSTTGYTGTASYIGGTPGGSTSTSGFDGYGDSNAGWLRSGNLVFTLIGSNTWTMTGAYRYTTDFAVLFYGVSPALSGILDRISITTTNGTDTFDAGTINIMYEG